MAFAYFLEHSPWLLVVIAVLWILARIWRAFKNYRNDRKRRQWNDMSKRSDPKLHARSLPHRQGAHEWY